MIELEYIMTGMPSQTKTIMLMSRMTRKKASFPCYGMQWGASLYIYPIDELSKEPAIARQLTSTPGPKRSAQFTPDSKEVYYLDRGRVFNVTLEKREPKAR